MVAVLGLTQESFRGRPLVFLVLLSLAAALVSAALTTGVSEYSAFERLSTQSENRLALYGVSLASEFDKYRNVPLVLASDPMVIDLLTEPTPERIEQLDHRVSDINRSVGAAAVYLIDRDGWAIVSSNWSEPGESFVGQHLDFRPYFVEARDGKTGRYFGIGSTAGQAGYYIAMPVRKDGVFLGVVAVKMVMKQVELAWAGGGERAFVTDPHGIVIITNTPAWRFHSLNPLPRLEATAVRDSRQYGDRDITPLNVTRSESFITIDGERYIGAARLLPDGNTLHVLTGIKEAQFRARLYGLLAAAVLGLAISGLYTLVHRATLRHRHTRDLEARVEQRTAALQAEVAERCRAEEELKAKQEELIQTAKLAALGQMSAGITHEINQPLAAIRAYAENGCKLVDLGRVGEARGNLDEITSLTDRLGRITGQLRQFARKATGQTDRVPVSRAVGDSLALVGERLRNAGVELVWVPPTRDLWVWGEDIRLEQVLINLIRNALDAMRETPSPRLIIETAAQDDTVVLTVRDTGSGIPAEVLPQLFDPFFTTKPAGEGLGLGLSISEGIIRAMGGQLSAANHPDGGAIFSLILKRAEAI